MLLILSLQLQASWLPSCGHAVHTHTHARPLTRTKAWLHIYYSTLKPNTDCAYSWSVLSYLVFLLHMLSVCFLYQTLYTSGYDGLEEVGFTVFFSIETLHLVWLVTAVTLKCLFMRKIVSCRWVRLSALFIMLDRDGYGKLRKDYMSILKHKATHYLWLFIHQLLWCYFAL